ncbi:MAG: hypothetical protein EBR82_68990 [Caulobacteraceae bacterium]|nr:hypothetical protein [Caulobacteraceae bacterium]
MTIDTSTIKAGDKLYLSDGQVVIPNESNGLRIAGWTLLYLWGDNGKALHPSLIGDIIRIEPKPEPVVETCLVGRLDGRLCVLYNQDDLVMADRTIYKLTFTDGKPSIERVK